MNLDKIKEYRREIIVGLLVGFWIAAIDKISWAIEYISKNYVGVTEVYAKFISFCITVIIFVVVLCYLMSKQK